MQTISWKNVPEQQINENVTRKLFWGENIMVTRWVLAPNATLPVHDHVSEQITMVLEGSVTLLFPGEENVTLRSGDMLVIPGSKPHGVEVGPQRCTVMDLFSPLRQDFIAGSSAYLQGTGSTGAGGTDPYKRLQGFLQSSGVKATLDELKEIPLDLLARYTYERQCITMGQLRDILGIDKKQAKALLRDWKHGDDHSESSYRRKMERMIMLPTDLLLKPAKSE
ncbi:MAG: cupin domain-containing protein [Desulfomonilaceae bacterium]